jgi:hypothetical protein
VKCKRLRKLRQASDSCFQESKVEKWEIDGKLEQT